MPFVAGLRDESLFSNGCLTLEAVAAFIDGLLTSEEMDRVQHHLEHCSSCNHLVCQVSMGEQGLTDQMVDVDPQFEAQSHPAGYPVIPPGFEVIRKLGSGPSGWVFEVFDQNREARVALKVLKIKDENYQSAFSCAFGLFSAIYHPNLVTLFDLHIDEHGCYYTMELVQGVDFITHVNGHKQTMRNALQQLCQGLLHLHKSGIVHRNLKPSNVLVTPRGRVVILDCGLTLENADETDRSSSGNRSAIAYMSPEQFRFEPATAASDWYSVGVLLYKWLTGHVPFESASGSLVFDKWKTDVASPVKLNPMANPHLSRLALQLLARDPATRATGPDILRQVATWSG